MPITTYKILELKEFDLKIDGKTRTLNLPVVVECKIKSFGKTSGSYMRVPNCWFDLPIDEKFIVMPKAEFLALTKKKYL